METKLTLPKSSKWVALIIGALVCSVTWATWTTAQEKSARDRIEKVVRVVRLVWKAQPASASKSLDQISDQVRQGEVSPADAKAACKAISDQLDASLQDASDPRYASVVCLATLWGDSQALSACETMLKNPAVEEPRRRLALASFALVGPEKLKSLLQETIATVSESNASWSLAVIEAGIQTEDRGTIELVIQSIPSLPPALAATVMERMTQRAASALPLLEAVAEKKVPKELFNLNQVRQLSSSSNEQVKELVVKIWGQIRADERGDRAKVLRQVSEQLASAKGDAKKGWAVYDRVCGQCHLLHGRGNEVGPNLSQNGRGAFEQLLSNVLDPSLVIGQAYQAFTVLTTDGRVITGLVVEDSDQQIVLRIQGGKTETIAKEDVEESRRSPQSLMPEGVESQMTAQEIADLFALLSLEKAPGESPNALIPGTPNQLHGR